MMVIGHFQQHKDDRFTGMIQTLTFCSDAVFIPRLRAEAGTPDYRISSGDTDLGEAWRETLPDGKPYILVKLDDPSFATPIYCELVKTGPREHNLLWQRAEPAP